MATQNLPTPAVNKRRKALRKRLRACSPITGRLLFDHHLRGDTAVLSDDLVADLFPDINLTGTRDIILSNDDIHKPDC